MVRISAEDWEGIIETAIKSGLKIDEWCADQGIERTTFYRHCRDLGFIKNRKRTEKWKVLSSGSIGDPGSPGPVLVPVPQETLSAVSGTVPENITDSRPSICIQSDSLKIFVGDGFRRETLRDVLEVVLGAQGS